MTPRADLTRPPGHEEIALARDLLRLGHGALSYTGTDGRPGISRIALGLDRDGIPLTLISSLALHSAGLVANPPCAVMMGEAGPKGDPLTHPRLMLRATARFTDLAERPALRALWLENHPKAKLYVDFADFAFVRLHIVDAVLNGGFGKAFTFTAADLRPAA